MNGPNGWRVSLLDTVARLNARVRPFLTVNRLSDKGDDRHHIPTFNEGMGDEINQSASGNASVHNMIGKIDNRTLNPHSLINRLRDDVERAAGSGDLDAIQARRGRAALNDMQAALDDDGPDRAGRLRRAITSFTEVAGHVARLASSANDISTAVHHLL